MVGSESAFAVDGVLTLGSHRGELEVGTTGMWAYVW